VDWIHLAQDRDQWWTVVNMVMNHRVPQKAGHLTSCVNVSFSRGVLFQEHLLRRVIGFWSRLPSDCTISVQITRRTHDRGS